MDLYKFAAQNGLRFPSSSGSLTVEQLFQIPLSSATRANLDQVAKTINTELKTLSEDSFVETTANNPRKKVLEASLEVVKDVIATKKAENAAELAKKTRSEERRKLLDAIGAKKDQQLTSASLEELEKKLAALD